MANAKKLPSGSWSVNIYIGKDKNGKRKYKRFTGADKRKVEREAAAYADEHRGEVSTDTFGYAARQYIENRKNILSPSTILNYNRIYRNYLQQWECVAISDIGSKAIQQLVNNKATELSPKTIRNIYGFITAVIYSVDPYARIKVALPAPVKTFRELPPPKDVIKAVIGTKCELPALLALWESLRMSEIRGLRFGDLAGNIITVRNVKVKGEDGDVLKSRTKNYDSTRRLALPQYIMDLIPRDKEPTDFIVPYSARRIYGWFQDALDAARLPHMSFHDLRHMYASIALSIGIPDKYAMESGGWRSPHVLKGVYQETFSAERQAADAKMNNHIYTLIDIARRENAT